MSRFGCLGEVPEYGCGYGDDEVDLSRRAIGEQPDESSYGLLATMADVGWA